MKNFIVVFIAVVLCATACKKGAEKENPVDNGNSPTTAEKIYYFTSDGVYLNNTKIANNLASVEASLDEKINVYANSSVKIFKNGTTITTANSVYNQSCYYVDGNDIYEGGYEIQGYGTQYASTRAVYWKNGVKMPLEYDLLSAGLYICSVSSITKFNGDIYLSGVSYISNLPNVPPYYMLWKNGKYVYPSVFYPYLAYQTPTTVKGQLIFVARESNGSYNLFYENGTAARSDWYDVSSAFSFLRCEFGEASYLVSTRIYNDIGYLRCKTGEVVLPSKYLYVASCTYNGKDEYICLADRTTQNYNIVYKNGVKMNLPAIFANTQIYKIIAK